MAEHDAVDELIEQWVRERRDLDFGPMATFGRLGRLMAHATASIEAVFAEHDLTIGDFDVIATIRRGGPPFVMRPTDLARQLMLSPAGMTSRLDRLVALELVDRSPDPEDRRSWRIRLTDRGRHVVDAAVVDHLANETRILEPLSPAQRQAFDRALRILLQQFEQGG